MAISIKKKGGTTQALPTADLGVHKGGSAATGGGSGSTADAKPKAGAAPFFRPPPSHGAKFGSPFTNKNDPEPTEPDSTLADAAPEPDAKGEAKGNAPEAGETIADNSLSTTMVEGGTEVPRAIYRTGRSGGAGLSPGDVVDDRYRIREPLGSGGMAQVWLAEHIAIEKPVAIKVLAPKGASADPKGQLAERFLREAKATAAIKHSGVVDITDFGRLPSGMPYFVMEHLEGATLHEHVINAGPMHWLDARDALVELADALIAAHEQGIVHCDLKPSNIFVMGAAGSHTLKIIDFGIAKLTQLSASSKNITTPGMVTGTPTYMSPEQTRGRKLDARTDIYALGCIAYFVMHGRPPFEAEENAMLLKMQLYSKPTPLRELVPEVPTEVERLVAKALEKDPEERFQTMAEFRDALAASGEDFEYEAKPYVREDAKTLIRRLDGPLKVSTSKHPMAAGEPLRPPSASDAPTIIPGSRPAVEAMPSRGGAAQSASQGAAASHAGASGSGVAARSSISPSERSGVSSAERSSARQPLPSRSMRSPAPVQPDKSPLVPVLIVMLLLALGAIGYLVATR